MEKFSSHSLNKAERAELDKWYEEHEQIEDYLDDLSEPEKRKIGERIKFNLLQQTIKSGRKGSNNPSKEVSLVSVISGIVVVLGLVLSWLFFFLQ